MIENAKELLMTKEFIAKFDKTINQIESEESVLSPVLAKAELDALIAQRDELINQVKEYEESQG